MLLNIIIRHQILAMDCHHCLIMNQIFSLPVFPVYEQDNLLMYGRKTFCFYPSTRSLRFEE